MRRILMDKPIVEIDGDEMARVMWHWVKERLIEPFVDLKVEYYDLHIKVRDETNDQITVKAAEAVKRWGVGVKCATITPNAERVKEYNLKKEWRSPNATIREILDGTIFRAPILVKNIAPAVRFWKKPIIVARHAVGDIYSGTGLRFEEPGEAEIVYRSISGKEVRVKIGSFQSPGVIQAYYNINKSIENFARAVFRYALMVSMDVWFAAKDTISKVYDATYREIIAKVFEKEFIEEFRSRRLNYYYYLIDDAYARAVRSEGGFIWAAKNYDGDVLSDMIASAFSGSLAMMTSELMSPEGHYLAEAAHGTVQKHYYRYLRGEKTSTNPTAIIFAWAKALKRRAELDGLEDLEKFAQVLMDATVKTIENGVITQDLSKSVNQANITVVDTETFIEAVKKNLVKELEETGLIW
ncbi:MAG: NADP-dependent isocitrate dehydrogenase [Desulfurococcaceae archaeon]|nr:NADP-dependent isocitrate dehydrogenase [Desulfurococcaceae archaeon]